MQTYKHQEIEKKWQKIWVETKLYQTQEKNEKPKYYVLDMFPYPSGAGLHVGHPKGYIATDILARQKMMQGYNVLHPMGWDAFGLPAENFALKNKTHPKISTQENILTFKKQLHLLGFTYDWEREINTTDPDFYHWTQWIFLQFYHSYYDERLQMAQPITRLLEKKFGTNDYYQLNEQQRAQIDAERLAFETFAPINWCPHCETGLANEDLEDGKCERCGSSVEKKPLRQWVLRITKYADRLLQDLKNLNWEEAIKTMQLNWIGRSEGALVKFAVKKVTPTNQENEKDFSFSVFTTRIDTLFGVSYLALAPELFEDSAFLQKNILNREEVENYLKASKVKTELERSALDREKTAVILEGLVAINPISQEEVPLLVADYVLADYGTGAVMGVPAHDRRDQQLAKKYQLPIKSVISSSVQESMDEEEEILTTDGLLINSSTYSGQTSLEARKNILSDLESMNLAEKKTHYKLRDWVFSRQRFWGEPIPIVHCKKCGKVPLPEEELPLNLPEVENYHRSQTGESPLINIRSWVETTCPHCGGPAERETNTMPQWAGSCWYYLRYIDPSNKKTLVDPKKEQFMMPVDLYVGGAEHATRHLIYARFWHKFLYDLGIVSTKEPFTRLQHVGLILASDGRKMSKRWGNIVNPDEIVAEFGADSLRVYEMFMGPFAQAAAWNTQGVAGIRRFLEKVWKLQGKVVKKLPEATKPQYIHLLHQTIKKVTSDLEELKFNTVVSSLMILTNALAEAPEVREEDYLVLLQLLAPLAPHLSEELWKNIGQEKSIFLSGWPIADEELSKGEILNLAVQVNGKLRAVLSLDRAEEQNEALIWEKIFQLQPISSFLTGKQILKKIYVPGKIVNLVTK